MSAALLLLAFATGFAAGLVAVLWWGTSPRHLPPTRTADAAAIERQANALRAQASSNVVPLHTPHQRTQQRQR